MWFFCGFITLIVFSIYNFKKAVNSSWKGSEDSIKNGLNYKHQNLGKILFLGCDAPKNIDFAIKPESKVDKFFKHLGLSEEMQIGEKDVDEAIYFSTENRLIIDAVKQSHNLQKAFLEIINLCKQNGFKLKRLNCCNGRIWLELKQAKLFKDFNIPVEGISETFVPIFKNITDEIDAKIVLSQRVRDPFLIRAAAILCVNTGSLFYALSFFLAHHYLGYPQLVELKPLIFDAAIVGLLVVIIMSVITIKLLGKTSRAHLVLIEIVFIGFFSFTASAAFLIMDINSEYDSSESHFSNVQVEDKRFSHGPRSRKKYRLSLNNSLERYQVEVSSSFYSQIKINDILCSEEKSGFMGYRWIKSLSKEKCL